MTDAAQKPSNPLDLDHNYAIIFSDMCILNELMNIKLMKTLNTTNATVIRICGMKPHGLLGESH
jgi:hypothetical protein